MIQDDREGGSNPIYGSIFLRLLPVPLIMFLHEKGAQDFLQAYKSSSFESPILIWNDELRHILESEIRTHSQEFIEQLKVFSRLPPGERQLAENFPIFQEKFNHIVRYPQIESEVRCGRYYLRVWVQQKRDQPNFFRIPEKEEEEF